MVVYGASGHALVVAEILKLTGKTELIFWDDDQTKKFNFPVSAPSSRLPEQMVIAIGNNTVRSSIASRYPDSIFKNYYVHPHSIVSDSSFIGAGTVIMAGAAIIPFVNIGKHCIINTNATIDHECNLGDFVHVSPGAILCGNVTVGEGTWVGAGAVIKEGVSVGRSVVIGAGSVILKDIPDFCTVVGNPGRIIRNGK